MVVYDSIAKSLQYPSAPVAYKGTIHIYVQRFCSKKCAVVKQLKYME